MDVQVCKCGVIVTQFAASYSEPPFLPWLEILHRRSEDPDAPGRTTLEVGARVNAAMFHRVG